ncbi:MAG: hypothetical protein WDA10_06450 [Porticoccaceae bacterium]|jgi:hypothetical protein|nr:hypothetical protein [Porticoccaceae bacterium]MEA3299074.1 hypothetical protein [Pseudomonadota bacterium]HLS97894.1 hypothetical protein [Porticoccaceae bacterium]
MGKGLDGTAILARYASDADGTIIIDVAAQRVDALYNTFDRFSPDARKDLDGDLVAYVVECAREISPRPLRLRINLPDLPDSPTQASIRRGFHGYFTYLADLEGREMSRTVRGSGALLAAGLVLLLLAVLVTEHWASSTAILPRVFAEGLTVAAWVALWQVLATYLIHWAPYRRALRLYRTLAATRVDFSPTSSAATSTVANGP